MMDDFNADNAKIDAALAAKCRVIAGTYTGDGAASKFISLPFSAKAVCVWPIEGERCNDISSVWSARATADAPQTMGYSTHAPCLTISGSGFTVYYRSEIPTRSGNNGAVYTNYPQEAFAYIAIA